MSSIHAKGYLDELRRLSSGGKVTVYRNREWIVEALREGNQKRRIYDLLVKHEDLKITYQQFAKLTTKLLNESELDQRQPLDPATSERPRAKHVAARAPIDAARHRFEHNPIPNEDELF